MKLQDFLSVFADGLDATEISLIPLKTDAVFVGDIIDSRIEKVRALFALGLDDSVPRAGRDSALIADKDIERLAAVKTVVEPTVAEVNLRNRENFCLNLCTFTDFLFLSYPRASGGDTPTLCEVFRYVQGAFADVNGAPIFAKKEADELYACSAITPAVRRLLVEKSKFESGVEDTRKSYSSLYAALVEAGVTDHVSAMERAERSDFISRGKELFLGGGKISPTLL
jgi:ATP-dependent helicase/DNAse subunit B